MHMCISDIVKKKLNLTDKFVYGSVLPDIIKNITKDRNGTHYIKKVVISGEERSLPDVNEAIYDLDIEDREIKLGYIAHLIEDFIWFNDYIPTYAKKLNDGKLLYLKDNSVHESEDFSKDMYSDYTNNSAYVIDKCDVDIEKLKNSLKDIIKDDEHIKCIEDNTYYTSVEDIDKNIFMTKESIDKYIDEASDKVYKIIKEMLGE